VIYIRRPEVSRRISRTLACSLLLVGATWVAAGPASAAQTTPIFECAFAQPDGSYVTVWGYQNAGATTESIPVGAQNRFQPTPNDRGQPTTFDPGTHDNILIIPWDGADQLGWKIGTTTVHADASQVCPTNPVPLTGSGLSTVVALFVLAVGAVGLNAHLYMRRRARQQQ
jgi:hypothetical protein